MVTGVKVGCCILLLCGITPCWADQHAIPSIAKMPDLPKPFVLRDWKQVARDFDTIVFDENRTGRHLPLIWWDTRREVNDVDGFAIPSYVGDARQNPKSQVHEAITSLAAVLGATVAGIDKSDQHGRNYVAMLPIHFHQKNGLGLYLNHPSTVGDSYWYDIQPSLLFYHLFGHYPNTPGFREQVRSTADVWRDVMIRLAAGKKALPDFDHTGFNFVTKKPVTRGWQEPDVAAGIACVEYLAYKITGEPKYLETADGALRWLDAREENPFYECLLPYGAYAAARSNAERGTAYDTGKLIDWVLAGDNPRRWGAVLEKWHGTEAYGLIGSVYPDYEYAFTMNTFQAAGIIAPIARYQEQYARDIAKWMLNVAVNGRYFYANAWPKEHQSSYQWAHAFDPTFSIPYEGLRKQGMTRSYPEEDEVSHGGMQEIDHPGPDKKMTLTADADGKLFYQGKIDVPAGAKHTFIIRSSHRRQFGGKQLKIRAGRAKEGPFETIMTLGAEPVDDLKQAAIAHDGATWIRVEADGLENFARIKIEDILIETRFPHPPHVGGDPTVYGWASTDLGLYGGAFAGFLAALIEPTSVEGIVAFDPVATDMLAPKTWPTRLLFNPYADGRQVTLQVGAQTVDVYDALTNRFLARMVSGPVEVRIPAKQAVMLVYCPAGGALKKEAGKLLCEGVVIDYAAGNAEKGR